MATVQIPDLPVAIALSGTEQIEIVQSGTSKSATPNQIAALAQGSLTVPVAKNLVFSGPTIGANATPTFRSLVTADFPASGVTAATYGDASHVGQFTVDATGRVTSAAAVLITGGVTSVGLSMPSEFTVTNSPVTTTGTLTVTWNTAVTAAHGGTGQSSYAIGDLLFASGVTALSKLADVATGNALISGGVGVAPAWGKIALTTHISGILPVANGGTNISSYAIGDIIFASAAGVLSPLADVATGSAIISGGIGVAPSYGKIGLTTHISGILPVANGGTNISAYTIGDLIFASTAGILSPLTDVATGNALLSGGVGVAPAYGKVSLTAAVSGILPTANGGTGISNNPNVLSISFIIDGGGSVLSTGVKGDLQIPFACTVSTWTLLADQSGSIVVNVWKQVYGSYPPTVAQKITASAPPTITTATNAQSSTLTGWTTTMAANDTLRFNVDSVTTITRVTLQLTVTRT